MNVEYSGWREDCGFFCHKIYLDEKREDYEIHLKNGSVGRQVTPFQEFTYDWNHDDDVYPLFGAFFEFGTGRDFLTPVDMVSLLLEDKAEIPGMENPLKKPTLDERLSRADSRKTQGMVKPDNPSPER